MSSKKSKAADGGGAALRSGATLQFTTVLWEGNAPDDVYSGGSDTSSVLTGVNTGSCADDGGC